MNTKLKKLMPLFALASCLTTTSVFAGEDANNAPKAQYSVPPAKNPGGEEALAFYIKAAYTFWVPYQEGNNLASSGNNPTADVQGNILRPSIQGASGFKVGIGANTMHDGWMVGLNYAWFYNGPAIAVNPLTAGTTYEPTFTDFEAGDSITAMASKWSNQFNRIDGLVDRAFYAGHYLTFRPWLGLLGAWENQNLDADDTFTVLSDPINGAVRWTQNWWGIGPYAGCEASFYFTNEWALYISSGGSMLLSNHNLTQVQTDMVDDTASLSLNLKDGFYNVEPMIETSLGLRWESFWTEWALCLDLSWELQTYFSHNGFQSYNDGMGVMGNYSMQGVTAGATVSF